MVTALDIIKSIVSENEEIANLSFIAFSENKTLQDRIKFSPELSDIIENALGLREKYSLPFWDSFNLSLFGRDLQDFSFLEQTMFHNEKRRIYTVERSKVNPFLESFDGDYLTFNSKAILNDGTYKHVPLLDFHIPVSTSNQKICVAILKELNLHGYLLISGKSYHFYGKHLVSQTELNKFLSKGLLLSPIIDRAWIAHQLIEESCCLRISRKYFQLPELIFEL